MDKKVKFARVVLDLMKENDVKRKEVAEAVNVKYSTFCDYVNPNHPSSPALEELFSIADYFGVTVDSLIDEELGNTSKNNFHAIGRNESLFRFPSFADFFKF